MENKSVGKLASFKQLLSRNFILLLLVNICNNFGNTMDTQIFTIFGEDIGMTAAAVTLMATLYSVATLVMRPFAGRITDRLNLKLWLVIIMVLKAGAYIMQGLSPNGLWLTIARVCTGLVFCCATTAFFTGVAHFVDKKVMATGMGVMNAIPGLIVSLAPSIATSLYQGKSAATTYIVAAAFSIPAIVFILLLDVKNVNQARIPQKAEVKEKKRFNINNYICVPALPICFVTYCVAALIFACSLMVVPMSRDRGLTDIAIFFSMYTLFKVVGGLAGGILGDLLSSRRVIPAALILEVVCCVLLANGHSTLAIGAAGALYAIAYQGIMPVTKKAAALLAPPEQRGAAIGTNMLTIDIAGVTGSLLPGLLNAHFGYTTTFYCMIVFPVIGFILYMMVAKKLDAIEKG